MKTLKRHWFNNLQGWSEVTFAGSFPNMKKAIKQVKAEIKAIAPGAVFESPRLSFDCDLMKDSYTFRITGMTDAGAKRLSEIERHGF